MTNDSAPASSGLRLLPWLILLCALAPRIAQYASGRPLWMDESMFAEVMVSHSPGQLLGPLRYNCVAPPGYFVASKSLIETLGHTEHAARLFPFLGGVASLFLWLAVARRISPFAAVCAGLALFGASKHMIYYGAEVRPYSTDATAALALLWAALYFEACSGAARRALLLGLIGALAPWFSYPAVFFLGGIGLTQVGDRVLTRRARDLKYLALPYGCWIVSLAVLYVAHIARVSRSGSGVVMDDYWAFAGAFFPFPPANLSQAKWLPDALLKAFDNPVGMTLPALGAFAALAGAVVVYGRSKKHFFLLVTPLLFALAASALQRYPFYGRMSLYLVPVFALLMGEGVGHIVAHPKTRRAGIVLLVMLLAHPAARAARLVVEPSSHHEVNRTLDYVAGHWQEGDFIYFSHVTGLTFNFCKHRYRFSERDYRVQAFLPQHPSPEEAAAIASRGAFAETPAAAVFAEQWPELEGRRRVWIPLIFDSREAALEHYTTFDAKGRSLDQFEARGAIVRLYDLSAGPVPLPSETTPSPE